MASSKIEVAWDTDVYGNSVLFLSRKRGKLGMEEVEDFLRYSPYGTYQGNWVILIRAGAETCGDPGWLVDESENPKGDQWELYQVESGEKCPVCRREIPDYQWCPACGEPFHGEGPTKQQALENVEKVLGTMKKESLHMIETSEKEQVKKAWYYSHLGSIDLARQTGLITEERRLQLYREFDKAFNFIHFVTVHRCS